MLLYNHSKLPQIISNKTQAFPITVYPGMVVDSSGYDNLLHEYFSPFSYEVFRNKKRVGLVRDFAMGDLIQLIPAARIFKEKYNIKEIEIYTSHDYVPTLKKLFSDIIFSTNSTLMYNKNCEIVFHLNGMLERDHSITNTENQLHRVNIYLQLLNLPHITKCNWNPNPMNIQGANLMSNRKKIGLQIRGSGYMKTLPEDVIKSITSELTKKYTVVLIDQSRDKGFNGEHIINTCGELNPYQVTALLSKLDCCITMDSGILWLAHVANCPVLTLLGPTREEERISLHPQYPNKAKSINISKMVGCEPCFETKVRCKGRIRCMKDFDKKQLIENILQKISEIVGE